MVNIEQYGYFVFLVYAHKVLHDLLCGYRVKRGHGFVRKYYLRVLVKRPRERYALLLAAAQLVAAGIGLIQNAHLVQTFKRAHLLLLGEYAEQYLEEGHIGHVRREHVLYGGAAGDQIEALEYHAHLAAVFAQCLAAQRVYVHAVNGKLSLCNVVHTVDAAQYCGLACAGKADYGHELALLYFQVYVL